MSEIERIQTPSIWLVDGTIDEQTALQDDTVQAVLAILEGLCVGPGWQLEGADAPRAQEMIAEALSAFGWSDVLSELIRTIMTRWAVFEVVYNRRSGGYWLPVEYRFLPKSMCRVVLGVDGGPSKITVTPVGKPVELALERAIFHRNRPIIGDPLGGRSALDHLLKRIQRKQSSEQGISEYLSVYGSPLVAVEHPSNFEESQISALADRLVKLRRNRLALMPKGVDIKLHEASSSGGVSIAVDKLQHDERAIFRAILGPVLALLEAEYGTRAQSQTHLQVCQQVIRQYQAPIEKTLNEQLIRPLIAMNLGVGLDVRWALIEPDMSEPTAMANMLEALATAGFIDVDGSDRDIVRQRFGFGPLGKEGANQQVEDEEELSA